MKIVTFKFSSGYFADQLSEAQEIRGNRTIKVKNESRGFHLNNLSYAGPIVMGVGGKKINYNYYNYIIKKSIYFLNIFRINFFKSEIF